MNRKCTKYLLEWLKSEDRLPLIIRGARQVGKTWIVRNLSELSGRKLVEVNFEYQENIVGAFESNDPKEIVKRLEELFGFEIKPETSLLFLDEIQANPPMIAKLRWFAERMPELAVIAAGSLLEFVLGEAQISMPVGRIEYMYLEPLSLEEFLEALDKNILIRSLNSFNWKKGISPVAHEELSKLFREYVLVGGMPAAVENWIRNGSLIHISRVHHRILQTYQDDFPKYAPRLDAHLLRKILEFVTQNLGNKFVYSRISATTKIPVIKKTLTALCNARVCSKVLHTDANGLPLYAQADEKFLKILLLDVGLCSSFLKLSLKHLESVDDLTLINKSGIAEQVVGQGLRTLEDPFIEPSLYYWIRPKKGSDAEVDYILQYKSFVIPVEVKAGGTGKLRSLHQFVEQKGVKNAIRLYSGAPERQQINVKNYQDTTVSYTLHSIPFYLQGQLYRLLDDVH